MRKALIGLVVLGAMASIMLCASYGWDQATETKDRITQAFIYGFVSAATLALHVLALRLWVSRWRCTGAFVGAVAMLAFIMTCFTSLGGLATRSDKVLTERQDALDNKEATRRQIAELLAERSGLKFKRTTQAGIDALQLLADAAKTARVAECGNGDPRQRGRFCRDKEDMEAKAISDLASAQVDKAATDRFDAIEAQLASLRSAGRSEVGVGAADPLKALLAKIVGSFAERFSAWQKAVFAVVFDLVLVAMIIGIDALGHGAHAQPTRAAAHVDKKPTDRNEPAPEPQRPTPVLAPPPKPKLIASSPAPVGSVRVILTNSLQAAPGQRVEIAELGRRYREVCKAEGKRPVSMDEFIEGVEKFCKALDLKRRHEGGNLFILDVQLVDVEHKSVSR